MSEGTRGLLVALAGPTGFTRDLVAHMLVGEGLSVVALGEHAAVTLLVEPAPEHWDAAEAAGAPMVLIALSDLESDDLMAAVMRGADAVLNTNAEPAAVVRSLAEVAAGRAPLTPRQVAAVLMCARRQASPAARVRLTARERDILAAIEMGQSVKQTARALGIAPKTVENLQSRMFRKIGARNRAQAVARAHAYGLLDARAS